MWAKDIKRGSCQPGASLPIGNYIKYVIYVIHGDPMTGTRRHAAPQSQGTRGLLTGSFYRWPCGRDRVSRLRAMRTAMAPVAVRSALPVTHVGQRVRVDRVPQVVEFVHRHAPSLHGDHEAALYQPG